jgi:hypothetical protein
LKPLLSSFYFAKIQASRRHVDLRRRAAFRFKRIVTSPSMESKSPSLETLAPLELGHLFLVGQQSAQGMISTAWPASA